MSQEDIKAEVARKALALCRERIASKSNVALPHILDSTQKQLEWLVEFFEGNNAERHLLRELSFGHFAVREMNESDTEFINALTKAYYVAARTASGLKIDLSVLNENP